MGIRAFASLVVLPLLAVLAACSCCPRQQSSCCPPPCGPVGPRAGTPKTEPDPQPFARFRFHNDDADEDVMPATPNPQQPPPPYVDGSKLHLCTFVDCSGSFQANELFEMPFAAPHAGTFEKVFGVGERFNRRGVWIALKVGAHPVRYSRLYLCNAGVTIRDMEIRYYNNGWEDPVFGQHNGRYRVMVQVFNTYGMGGGALACAGVPFDDFVSLEAPPAP